MTDEDDMAAVRDAMTLLHWELRDLFINTFANGDVGTEADLAAHLRSGNHLTPAQSEVVIATLNDALVAIGHPMRLGHLLERGVAEAVGRIILAMPNDSTQHDTALPDEGAWAAMLREAPCRLPTYTTRNIGCGHAICAARNSRAYLLDPYTGSADRRSTDDLAPADSAALGVAQARSFARPAPDDLCPCGKGVPFAECHGVR